MTYANAIEFTADTTNRMLKLPMYFLNCYEIFDPSKLAWAVYIYMVGRGDSR